MAYVSVRNMLLPVFRRRFADIIGAEFLPAKGPYILAANHIDYLDGFYIAAAVYEKRHHDVYFLTKTKNYWWTQATIPINSDKKSDSLDDAAGYLHEGRIICNFIEGTRNTQGSLLKGKTGTARLALLSHAPVIPVAIRGPIGRNFAHSLTNLLTERDNVTVTFGAAVNLSDFYGAESRYEDLIAATEKIMRSLAPLTGQVYLQA